MQITKEAILQDLLSSTHTYCFPHSLPLPKTSSSYIDCFTDLLGIWYLSTNFVVTMNSIIIHAVMIKMYIDLACITDLAHWMNKIIVIWESKSIQLSCWVLNLYEEFHKTFQWVKDTGKLQIPSTGLQTLPLQNNPQYTSLSPLGYKTYSMHTYLRVTQLDMSEQTCLKWLSKSKLQCILGWVMWPGGGGWGGVECKSKHINTNSFTVVEISLR